VLYPNLAQPESGYVRLAADHLPRAARGLLVAGFLAAFMSTIATHLNWGSSYLVSDFYRRFVRRNETEKHYVGVSRWITLLLVVLGAWVSYELVTIRAGWEVLLEVGAGTGSVYLLRWYWWRINAWSEIAAMATALIVSLGIRWFTPFHGSEPATYAKTTLVTTALTTIAWVAVTLLTKPEPHQTLEAFYRRVRPDVFGWKPIAATVPEIPAEHSLARNLADWVAGCAMIYFALFGVGKLCLLDLRTGAVLLILSVLCGAFVYRDLPQAEDHTASGVSAVSSAQPRPFEAD
jgi:Na+/proline symporter